MPAPVESKKKRDKKADEKEKEKTKSSKPDINELKNKFLKKK
jgi:hypothetical protein